MTYAEKYAIDNLEALVTDAKADDVIIGQRAIADSMKEFIINIIESYIEYCKEVRWYGR